MRIALLQMDIALGDVAANRRKAMAMAEEAIARGARLLVLPEMWTTGYKLTEIQTLAEPAGGPTVHMLGALARQHGVEIIAGSIAEERGGKVYNTSYAIGAHGAAIAKYSKIHLIGLMEEDRYLAPGDSKALFDLSIGKAGIIICYDLRFSELPRALALAGCQALFVPAEWPAARAAHWRALNIARAIENQMFVIAVNRVGVDDGNLYHGRSLVVDPWGEVLAEGPENDEKLVYADVDFAAVNEIRQRLPVFADRRPQYY